ncbi:MAG TPA: GNAT family protein [Solirubrobacterales bacterium]
MDPAEPRLSTRTSFPRSTSSATSGAPRVPVPPTTATCICVYLRSVLGFLQRRTKRPARCVTSRRFSQQGAYFRACRRRAPRQRFDPDSRVLGAGDFKQITQGSGTMTAAVRLLVDHALTVWQLNRVEIRAAVENRRSRAIPKRLGFRQVR